MNLITLVEMSTKLIFLFAFAMLVYGIIAVNSKYNDELEKTDELDRKMFRDEEEREEFFNAKHDKS